eukprot:scaffold282831_cov28-Prasinocladus_malaysianus.AAC.1
MSERNESPLPIFFAILSTLGPISRLIALQASQATSSLSDGPPSLCFDEPFLDALAFAASAGVIMAAAASNIATDKAKASANDDMLRGRTFYTILPTIKRRSSVNETRARLSKQSKLISIRASPGHHAHCYEYGAARVRVRALLEACTAKWYGTKGWYEIM